MTIESQAAQLAVALNEAGSLDPASVHALRALRGAIEPHLGLATPGRDPATGLGGRAQFEERLAAGARGSLCLFEVDGEPGEDIARVLRRVRDGDQAFRVGEREFALLLPATALVGARVVGERIADRIATETPLTASYGAADSSAGDPRGLYVAAASDLAARRRRRGVAPAAATV